MGVGRRLSDLKPVEKKQMCKEEVVNLLLSVVHGGEHLSGKQIMKKYPGTPRAIAYSVSVKAKGFLKPPPQNNYSKVRIPERAVANVESWREHLSDFPFAGITDSFAENWHRDVAESVWPDQMKADKKRGKRAHEMWRTFEESFIGKESMNTLLCIIYSPNEVSKLVQHVSENGVCLAHVLVLRDGGAFLLLLTDVDPQKQFPLAQFMRGGVHTSAFLWVNLKEAFWESHSKTMTLVAVAPTKALQAKQLTKVSEATVSGMHILAVMWMRAKELVAVAAGGATLGTDAQGAPAAPLPVNHVYVQPNKALPTAGDGVGADATTAPWVLEIQAFVDVFPIKEAVAAMLADGSSAEAQVEGCRLLWSLAYTTDENRTAIARAGGIEAVVAGMGAHGSSEGVQEQGCLALGNLAVDKENMTLIARAGGIEALVAGMRAHESGAGVQKEGVRALGNLAWNEENRTLIARAGGIEALVAGMRAHKSGAGVQEGGCGALRNLAGNEENRTLIARAGGIEALVAGMRAHESIVGVQKQGRRTLKKLALDEENVAAIAKAWEPPPIVRDVFVCFREYFDQQEVYKTLESSDGGTYTDCWAAQLVGNATVTISTNDNVTSRTITATYEDGTIFFETVMHQKDAAKYRAFDKDTNGLRLFWGSKQEMFENHRGRPWMRILPGGRARLQIRNVHCIDLLQECPEGVWCKTDNRCLTK
jgi:hypothetical protein